MQILISIFVLILAIPAGYILKHYTKEELKTGKKYFKILWISCLVLMVGTFFIPIDYTLKKTFIFSFLFIAVVSFISEH